MLVEGCVDVVEKLVTRFDCYLRGLGNGWPEVEFLMNEPQGVMITVEGVEGPQHSPACTEFYSRVACVAANIRSDHRNLVDSCKCDHFGNRNLKVGPIGVVVTEPMADVTTGTRESAASYDQRPQARATVDEGSAACFTHHGTEEVMGVVFRKTVGVDQIGVKSEIANGAGFVVDRIWWIDEVAIWQTHHGARSSNLSLFEVLAPSYTAGRGRLEIRWKSGNRVSCIRADWWRCRGVIVGGRESCWVTARVGAEVGGFVHVDPKSIDVNAIGWIKESGKFPVPIVLCSWIEPVREGGDTWPDDT